MTLNFQLIDAVYFLLTDDFFWCMWTNPNSHHNLKWILILLTSPYMYMVKQTPRRVQNKENC